MDQKPNSGLALVGSLMPLCFALGALPLLGAAVSWERLVAYFEYAGGGAYGVVIAAGLVALALLPLIFLVGRGRSVPVVIPLILCAVPWFVGLAGLQLGAMRTFEALVNVHPDDKPIILMAGFSESAAARVLGAWSTSALLLGASAGLALCALAQRPTRRAALAVLAAIPAAGIVAVALWAATVAESAQPIVFVALPAVVFAASLGVAGAGLGTTEEGRATSFAGLGAGVAGLFGVIAGVASFEAVSTSRSLEALAWSNADEMVWVLANGLGGVIAAGHAFTWAVGLGALALVAFAAVAFLKARPTAGAAVGTAVAILVLAGATFADATSIDRAVRPLVSTFGAQQDFGVRLPVLPWAGERSRGASLVVGREGIHAPGPAPLAALQPEHEEYPRLIETLRERRRDMGGGTVLEVALDARLDAVVLSELGSVGQELEVGALRFSTAPSLTPLEDLGEPVPPLIMQLLELSQPRGTLELALPNPSAPQVAPYVGTVAASGNTEIRGADGAVAFVAEEGARGDDPVAISLGAAPGVTVDRYLQVAGELVHSGRHEVILAVPERAQPLEPEQPLHAQEEASAQ